MKPGEQIHDVNHDVKGGNNKKKKLKGKHYSKGLNVEPEMVGSETAS